MKTAAKKPAVQQMTGKLIGTPKIRVEEDGHHITGRAETSKGKPAKVDLRLTDNQHEKLKAALEVRTPDKIPAEVSTTARTLDLVKTLGKDTNLPKSLQKTLGKIKGPGDTDTLLSAISGVMAQLKKRGVEIG